MLSVIIVSHVGSNDFACNLMVEVFCFVRLYFCVKFVIFDQVIAYLKKITFHVFNKALYTYKISCRTKWGIRYNFVIDFFLFSFLYFIIQKRILQSSSPGGIIMSHRVACSHVIIYTCHVYNYIAMAVLNFM